MVHQTIPTRINPASKASSSNSVMMNAFSHGWRGRLAAAAIVGMLSACALGPSVQIPAPDTPAAPVASPAASPAPAPVDLAPAAPASGAQRRPPVAQPQSRWVAQDWSQLPGWQDDELLAAWPAWQRSCERPHPDWRRACQQLRQLGPQGPDSSATLRAWIERHLQAWRVEREDGQAEGLLTAYFEPLFKASRLPRQGQDVPLHALPPELPRGTPWFSRAELDRDPQGMRALRGLEIAYLSDPLDALILQIQGSGLLQVREPDGRERLVRLAYAGHNGHPYRSVGRWLLDQGLVRDASWPGIKDWAARHPQRLSALLHSNPRVVFFREEALPEGVEPTQLPGPRGAQGVPLSAGRSIAIDPTAMPYGSPVWLVSPGPSQALARLVVAQDTGSAIIGAVRADYFVGAGAAAGDLAGRLKQPLQMWVLWPR